MKSSESEPGPSSSTEKKKVSSPLMWVFGLLGFLCAWRPLADMDFPWHLAMGEAIAEQGPRLAVDPISYLDFDREVNMGAWLGEWLFALCHRSFGLEGLALLVALVAALSHLLVFHASLVRCRDEAAAALATALFSACSIERWRGRPDIFSILLFFLLLTVLRAAPSARRRALLFGLTLLWMNLHPGAIVVPAFIAMPLVASFFRNEKSRVRALGLDLVACLVALLVTPFSPLESWKLVSMTVSTGHLVSEWLPLWDQPWTIFWREWTLASAVLAAALIWRPRRRVLSDILAAAMALRSFRLLYMLTPLFEDTLAVAARPRRRPVLLGLAIVVMIALPLQKRWSWYQKTKERGDSPVVALYEPHYPVAAADFIESHGLEGRLFHPVRWGGYLGWRLAPRNRSAHDGRISLWGAQRAEAMEDYLSAERREALRAELGFEILVMPTVILDREEQAALGGRWLPVHADPTAVVYIDVRAEHGEPNLERVRVTTPPR